MDSDLSLGYGPQVADGLDWAEALVRVGEPGAVRPVFQPIVDLRRGVVTGYEMLARFTGPPMAPPNEWFAQAAAHGLAPELEARLIGLGLDARQALPENTFLTINVGPESLDTPEVQAALAQHHRLHGVVIELTEHTRVEDDVIAESLPPLRARGAMIALDDVGAGYSGLRRIGSLRPDFVKIDRALIEGLHSDPAKREMVESLGAVANRIDAWVIAEGIEERTELEALMRLGVPLGQGFGLARPELTMIGPSVALTSWMRERAAATNAESRLLRRDVEPVPAESWIVASRLRFREEPQTRHLPVVDERGRPVGIVARGRDTAGDGTLASPLRALQVENPAHLARRAMARSPQHRFDPVVCCDETGRYLGLIEIEALVEVLAERLGEPEPA